MPHPESHWLAERLAYLGRSLLGDAVWRQKASQTFPRLQSDPKAEGRHKPMGETLFVRKCRTALCNLPGSSDLSWPQKELYRKLVVGSTSDLLSKQRGWTAEELGARFKLLEQLWVLTHWVTCTECFAPFQLKLQGRPGRHARLCLLWQWSGRNGWAHLLLLRVLGSCQRVDGSHWTQAALAARHWLHHRQHFTYVSGWEACGVSRDLSCCQNGDLDNAKERMVWWCKLFSSWSGFVF